MIGRGNNSNIIYLIDFGLAQKYRDEQTKVHSAYKSSKEIAGTVRYSSINAHLGFQLSRRDDLESFVYSFIYLAKGSLPWQGINEKNKNIPKNERHGLICRIKTDTKLNVLCKGLSPNFYKMAKYIQSLSFEEEPDYSKILSFFENDLKNLNLENDDIFDWHINTNIVF